LRYFSQSEAVRKIERREIDCFFLDVDDITRELWEIDENLIRAELTPAQEAKRDCFVLRFLGDGGTARTDLVDPL
jgi:hypothetical protein